MKWIWHEIDEGRFARAMKEKPARIDPETETAVFNGEHGVYTCSLSHCDCPDFQTRLKGLQPCKHILSLGAALNAYDPQAVARRFEGQRAKDRLSLAYGRYHLFHDPIMTDSEYDALKREWAELLT